MKILLYLILSCEALHAYPSPFLSLSSLCRAFVRIFAAVRPLCRKVRSPSQPLPAHKPREEVFAYSTTCSSSLISVNKV